MLEHLSLGIPIFRVCFSYAHKRDRVVSVKKSPVISFKYFIYDFIRLTALPILLWFRPKRVYSSDAAKKSLKGGLILMSNHISLKDPLYLISSILTRRHHFLTATEVIKTGFSAWWFKHAFLCIEINRSNFSLKSLREISNHLEAGEMVSMFPEGHINIKQEEINQFKGGIVMMAYQSRSPIVPAYIRKKPHWWSRLVVFIGEKIDIKDCLNGKPLNASTIKEASRILEGKEKELELLCNNYKKRG